MPGAASPLVAVGDAVIDLAPPGSKDFMVSLFGTNDKLALLLIVAAAVLAVGALLGLLGRRSTLAAGAGIVLLTGVGTLAALRDPGTAMTAVLVSWAAQSAVGYLALTQLLTSRRRLAARPPPARRPGVAGSSHGPAGWARWRSSAAGSVARCSTPGRRTRRRPARRSRRPSTRSRASAPTTASRSPGSRPLVMPNDRFYRIDTALLAPVVDLRRWKLRVHGMVDQEVTLTFDELVALPLIEHYMTIACVCNEVGGDLVGNAKWTGVPLTDVLEMAGVQAGATQIVAPVGRRLDRRLADRVGHGPRRRATR